jgi:ZIP family zinc transporter
MLEAFGWGLLAQSSLLLAGLLVCWVTVPTKVVGILGGFGAGAMIAAVSFDLLPEAQTDIQPWQTSLWMLVGVAVFLVADQLVERRFGSEAAGGAWASSWGPSSMASLNPRSSAYRSASA